jgi:23S rRNA pseudouridine1911/1915/1917 synthase
LIVDSAGKRLDRYVSEKCRDISRTFAQKLIEDGNVTLNGKVARPSAKLKAGDLIKIVIPPPVPSPLEPENIPLRIVYEDNDLMVVDKPAGMTVHPAPGHHGHTLVNAVLAHVPDLVDMEGTDRPGIVHRLDKDTSGLIIVAKNVTAHMMLAEQFKNRTIAKTYIALVKGRVSPDHGVIEGEIGRDPRDRKRMAVIRGGRQASTEYIVVRHVDGCTLLEVKPRSGRTHQIRVHLAAAGFPIIGDAIYGVKSQFLKRQFLHAHRLTFRLPSTGMPVSFSSELPADLADALKMMTLRHDSC